MLQALRQLFTSLATGGNDTARFEQTDYRLAAAVLLIHAATIDGSVSPGENERLHALIAQRFDLDEAAAGELIAVATQAEQQAIDLYQFTSLLNRTLDTTNRQQIVEMMWQVAHADGRVTEFEDNLIWRAADLLHVSSDVRVALRQRVAQRHAP